MPLANDPDRRDFDTGASSEAQTYFNQVAGQLESLISQRDADVKAAMSDYLADGVADEYAAKEAKWNQVAGEVRGIIAILRASLQSNDETAGQTLAQARARVASIA
ncbi:MAG TPA: pore-forming ESAT-6 family protein [Propionibacteriaceae bacterium]|jgi:hypothetical protein